jgi:hypothetical protein
MKKKERINPVSLYLCWVNDFLTLEAFAEYHGVTVSTATRIIKLGRYRVEIIHNS